MFKAHQSCKNSLLPDAICRYIKANKKRYHPELKMEEARYVVLDTETTGLDLTKDKIISIGAVAIVKGHIQIRDSFEILIRQKFEGDASAVPIHGLLESEIQEGMEEAQALEQLLDFIAGDVLVAHHMWFDKQMLNRILKKHFSIQLFNDTLDTRTLAIRLEKGRIFDNNEINAEEYSLEALCDRYEIPLVERHTAAGDAFLTAILFQKLLAKARKKNILTIGSLLS